ncbi:MAG: thiolase family protein [Acidobacteria bacterium]|nr:thiolase family protein [Acidobacteriota bacterium]
MEKNKGIFIVGAARTPIGKFGGAFADLTAADLGTEAARATLQRTGLDPEAVEECIFGNARQAGGGPNVARQIAHRAGVPDHQPAYTVNKACGSGLKSVVLAFQEVLLGNASVILAGGTESMSRLPYYLDGARWGYRLGHAKLIDGMYQDGFLCPLSEQVMGETAENLVDLYQISREEQDEFALRSHQRALQAMAEKRFQQEIVPVTVVDRKGNRNQVQEDEHPRPDTTRETLSKLPAVFRKNGSVSAGNSSGITDGAAAMLVVSEEALSRFRLEPQVRVVDYTIAGVDPKIMGIGPVPAVRKLLERQKLRLSSVSLIELNEAFAAQVLACQRDLKFDSDQVNVNGGAIALGHPIGCTGARILVTLVYEMLRRNAPRGIATLCISGGMGMAMLVEKP